MNRKNITRLIIIGIVLAALIGAGFAYQYFSSFRKVTFTVQQAGLSADIYQRNPNSEESDSDTKMGTIKNGQVLSLQPAKYYAVPTDTKYDNAQISFTVADKDMSVTVDPGFSPNYLASILAAELPAINSVISAKYASVLGDFTVNSGKLYLDGSWYGTTITQKSPGPGQLGDVYRTVLHKVNGKWQFAATPALVLTSPDHTNIPNDILVDLNKQSGY
jgi:hypothetical protein